MATYATPRKLKVSFTLSPEVVAFVKKTRVERGAGSDSEALDLLLKETAQQEKLRQLDAAVKEYYDNATDEELAFETQWAEANSSNMWIGIPE
jgi:hypothetical protein